ncbi:MAG TPA: dTMP kinase [Gammaproteobacteria bacterium]|nr:dTMP kinase [Gammaproteobacteria bacterium]HJP42321.1 dTMP kinase [Gammaproteobacteria bacterium]
MSGFFITIEGIECVGKTTNAKFIVQYLSKYGIKTHQTREPGGTVLGEKIRNMLLFEEKKNITPLIELLLLFAAREANTEQVIKPALKEGTWVVCDRFTDASIAYQGFGRELGYQCVENFKEIILKNFEPDITFLLDAPVKIIRSRKKLNQNDRFESETTDFFEKVRNGYLDTARRYNDRIKVIDASKPLEDVQLEIKKYLKAIINHHD